MTMYMSYERAGEEAAEAACSMTIIAGTPDLDESATREDVDKWLEEHYPEINGECGCDCCPFNEACPLNEDPPDGPDVTNRSHEV